MLKRLLEKRFKWTQQSLRRQSDLSWKNNYQKRCEMFFLTSPSNGGYGKSRCCGILEVDRAPLAYYNRGTDREDKPDLKRDQMSIRSISPQNQPDSFSFKHFLCKPLFGGVGRNFLQYMSKSHFCKAGRGDVSIGLLQSRDLTGLT
jgi:hypothetical protein